MRSYPLALCLTVVFVGLLVLTAPAQDEGPAGDPLAVRYGLPVNALSYPQSTPLEALKAFVRALDKNRMEYLVAQLADPRFIDERVAEYRMGVSSGSDQARTFLAFDRMVREVGEHYFADPQLQRELRLLARDAKFEVNDNQALGVAESVPNRRVYLRRYGARWFLENRQQ
jgi:hypothetical protein